MKILVANYDNNMGDVMAQMGALKEWVEKNPNNEIDFISCFWLHYEAARHTDLFKKVTFLEDREYIIKLREDFPLHGYDKLIDFKINMGEAMQIGLKKSWGKNTLGFTPANDKPYFLISEDEANRATNHFRHILGMNFRKHIIFQLYAPSNPARSIVPEDWGKVFDLIPEDVLVIYPGSMTLGANRELLDRKNVLVLPGYGLGETAQLMKLADLTLFVHGGFSHLAYAVDVKNIIQINFLEGGGDKFLPFPFPESKDLLFPSNKQIDYEKLKQYIEEYVV